MQKYIYSFFIGICFFLVAYFLIELSAVWSILLSLVSFFAGRLLFLDDDIRLTLQNINEKNILEDSEKKIKKIKKMLPLIDNTEITSYAKDICKLSHTILDSLEKYPQNLNASHTFLNYYLPVTVELLNRYEKIENQNLTSKESKSITKRITTLMGDVNESFKNHLNKIYNHELMDMDAEIDVFEAVLRNDGLLKDSILKGVEKDDTK